MKYSVIVPIYNTEKYLKQCIDSLLNQTYLNIEIILIDDGSKDNSLNICLEYQKIYFNKIRVMSQKNKGVSAARNLGIEYATGDYIIFVDSDDFCFEYMIEEIDKAISKSDLVTFGYNKFYKNRNIVMQEDRLLLKDKTEIINCIFLNERIGGYLFNKVFVTDIIKKYNLKFDENIHYCEDLYFVISYLKHCRYLQNIDKTLYNYRMRKSSITYDFYNEKNLSILKVFSEMIDKYNNNEKITSYLNYMYLLNCKKMEKIIKNKISMRTDVICKRKEILKNTSIHNKIKYYIIYHDKNTFRLFYKLKEMFYIPYR